MFSVVKNFIVRLSVSLLCWSMIGTTAFGATANNPISDVQGVTIIADTKGRDRLYGATVRLDLGKIALSDLRSMQVGFESITDIFSAEQRPVQVTVIVPSSELMFAQQQLKPEVVKIFRQRFGADRVNVVLRPINVSQVEDASAAANEELTVAQEEFAGKEGEAKEIADEMIKKNRALVKTLQDWRSHFREQVRLIKSDYDRRTMLVGSAMGAASSAAPVAMWLTTTGLNAIGMAQMLVTVLYDQLNTTFAGKLLQFEQEHELPGEKAKIPGLSKVIGLYNGSTFVKALGVNFAINAGTGFSFRLLSWLGQPDVVSSPFSVEFLASLGGINALGGGFTAAGDVGIRQLRRKGYISGFAETVVASSFNFLTQMNNLLLGSGMTEFLPYGLAVEWTTKSSFFLAAKVLPTKTNRFVLIMPGLDEENVTQVKKVMDLNNALRKEDLNIDQFRRLTADVHAERGFIAKLKSFQGKVSAGISKAQAATRRLWRYACQKIKR